MSDSLQENLLYLYENKIEIFDSVKQYLDINREKKCKLIYEENGFINLSYIFESGLKFLYANDSSDLEGWLKERGELKQGQYDVVMYGLGLTHHLAKLIEFNPLLNFYIIEPEIDIFVEALKVVNIEQLLMHPQVKLLCVGNNQEQLRNFHTFLNIYSIHEKIDLFIPFYAEVNLETVRQFYSYNYEFREAEMIWQGFEHTFGTQPYRNSIRNIEKMCRSLSIESLRNKFEGCAALVVGAGPSLEIDIEYIKQYKDKLLIIAAGSSIQSLLHFGLEPHIVVSMDPGEANGRVFQNCQSSNLPLIFIPQIYYKILDQSFSQLFYALFDSDAIINYLLPELDVDYRMRSTNSVTGTAIQVANYFGAEKILLVGQDMSFPNEQYYACGASHITLENLKQTVNKSQLEVENVKGSMNRTNLSMMSMRENIEALISSISGVDFINTSSLGAKIKGAEYTPFLDAVKNLKSNHDFTQIRSIAGQAKKVGNYEINSILERINKFVNTCDKLIASGEKSLKIIQIIDELARRKPEKAMSMLSKLEQEFSKVTENLLFKNIIPVWNHGLTKRYDQQVIKIEKEPSMVGKARLLNEIVVPYIKATNHSFNDMKGEFQQVYKKLENLNSHS